MYANRTSKVETRKRTLVQKDFSECEALTEQHHKQECDIINIVRKYDKFGLDFQMFTAEQCMDITDAPTYLEMQIKIAQANQTFEALPARIRAEFDNSTQNFLEAISDPENASKLEEIGIDASHLQKAVQSSSSDDKKDSVGKDKKSDKIQQESKETESEPSKDA